MKENSSKSSKSSGKKSEPKSKKKPKPKHILKIVFDPGTSLSKIFYVLDDGTVKYMAMNPEYLLLPSESAESLPVDSGMGKPEDNAWVRLSPNEDCHAVGTVAKNYRGTFGIKKLKQESLIFKVLATVGAIAQTLNLETRFQLELGVLLPYSEYAKGKESKEKLEEALSNFLFQTKKLNVKLTRFAVLPEGYGIARNHSKNDYLNGFKEENTVVIMAGFRNTSCLFFRQGTFSKSESGTTDLGFYTVIDKLIEKVPGLTRSDFLKSLSSEYKEDNWIDRSYDYERVSINFSYLAKELKNMGSEECARISQEIEAIEKAYTLCLKEYCILLQNWLEETLPKQSDIDTLIFAGGSYDLLSDWWSSYLINSEIRVLENQMESNLTRQLFHSDRTGLKGFVKDNLASRFADAWGFFLHFAEYDCDLIYRDDVEKEVTHG